jgi:hypothetical protein
VGAATTHPSLSVEEVNIDPSRTGKPICYRARAMSANVSFWPDGEIFTAAIGVGYLRWCRPDLLDVRLSACDPFRISAAILRTVLSEQKESDFGRSFFWGSVRWFT